MTGLVRRTTYFTKWGEDHRGANFSKIASTLCVSFALLALGCDTAPEGCAEGDEQCEKIGNFCSNVSDCEGIQMLISEDQCNIQTARRLGKAGHASRECRDPSQAPVNGEGAAEVRGEIEERACLRSADPCAACITDLTCAGMTEVAGGKVDVLSLCPNCDKSLSVRGSTPYLIVPGLAAAPPEEEEGAEEEAKEETEEAPAEAATPPAAAAPSAPAAASKGASAEPQSSDS